jgi:hypothetical protein
MAHTFHCKSPHSRYCLYCKYEAKKKLEHFYPFDKSNAAWKATVLDPRLDVSGFLSRDTITTIWKEIIQESSKNISETTASILAEEIDVEYEVEEEGKVAEDDEKVEQTGNSTLSSVLCASTSYSTVFFSSRIQQKKAYIESWCHLWINSKEG